MKIKFGLICLIAFLSTFGATCFGQETGPDQRTPAADSSGHKQKKQARSPGKETAKGGEDIGKGVGKGAASAGKGAAGAAVDLATLHPVGAGAALGKGAAGAGKDVGVGSAKGTAKIGKGVGGGIKKLGKKAVGKGGKNKKDRN